VVIQIPIIVEYYVAVCDKTNAADNTTHVSLLQHHLHIQVNGVSKCFPPSSQCAAIPPELFITAKVHHFHLQRQGSETNLPRINWFAFFIK